MTDNTQEAFGYFRIHVFQLLHENKMSQSDLAEEIDINQSTLNMNLRGLSKPSFYTINAIADYFNISIDWLLGRSNDKRIK